MLLWGRLWTLKSADFKAQWETFIRFPRVRRVQTNRPRANIEKIPSQWGHYNHWQNKQSENYLSSPELEYNSPGKGFFSSEEIPGIPDRELLQYQDPGNLPEK